LEANQFDLLPSSAQVRGFIRAYGEYLKLNSGELLQELDGEWKAFQVSTAPSLTKEVVSSAATNSDTIFKEIGDKLKSQRELMGLSLGDVERHTHIRMHYLQALEDGDISHLPSPVQGRGMLSNYASFLGLNNETILLRFADGLQASLFDRQAARSPNPTKPRQGEPAPTPARPSQMRRLFSMDLFAGGILIFFLIGFAIWGALRISALSSSQEPSPTAPPVSELLLSTQGEVISGTITIMPTSVSSENSTAATEVPLRVETSQVVQAETTEVVQPTPNFVNAPVQVYIVAKQRAWMKVTADEESVFEGRTMPGSAYTFSGNEEIILLTGNGGGLQVYYNQQDLGLLGTFGEVVEQVYSIQGVRTATPAILPTNTPAQTSTPAPTSTSASTSTPAIPLVTPIP
jgi:cytoskeletal protein RodZ